jgi:hypothetical protein
MVIVPYRLWHTAIIALFLVKQIINDVQVLIFFSRWRLRLLHDKTDRSLPRWLQSSKPAELLCVSTPCLLIPIIFPSLLICMTICRPLVRGLISPEMIVAIAIIFPWLPTVMSI